MIACLLEYVHSSDMVFKDVTFTFPIVGRSYLPPDKVFGRIKKTIRKREEILTPDGYHEILKAHGNLKVYPQNWTIMDYKGLAASTLKGTSALKLRDSRVWKFKKGSSAVQV